MNSPAGLKAVPLPQTDIPPKDDAALRRTDAPLRIEDFIEILRKRLWIPIVTTILAIVIAIFLLSTYTPQYVASAEMLLGGQGRVDRTSSDLLEARALSDTVIQGELAILESSALLVRVVQRLELDQDPEFNPALRPPAEPVPFVDDAKAFLKGLLTVPEQAPAVSEPPPSGAVEEASSARDEMLDGLGGTVGTLRRNMSVRQRGSSFVVAVTVISASPKKAAGIANTVVDEYINFVGDKRFEAAQRFTTWLETRVADLAKSVEESETAVISYQTVVESEVDSAARLDQQMQEMTSKLVDARATLAETAARATKARELLDSDGIFAAASVLSSPALDDYNARLADLRQEEIEAKRRFGEGSAQLDAIRREASDLRVETGMEVRRAIAELENRAEVLRINVDALRDSLGELKQIGLNRSKEQIQLNQLERVADANRRLYGDFLGRFKEFERDPEPADRRCRSDLLRLAAGRAGHAAQEGDRSSRHRGRRLHWAWHHLSDGAFAQALRDLGPSDPAHRPQGLRPSAAAAAQERRASPSSATEPGDAPWPCARRAQHGAQRRAWARAAAPLGDRGLAELGRRQDLPRDAAWLGGGAAGSVLPPRRRGHPQRRPDGAVWQAAGAELH